VVCDKRRENGLYEGKGTVTHLARTSQTFISKKYIQNIPHPGANKWGYRGNKRLPHRGNGSGRRRENQRGNQ
jgi:hypothetical protein